MNAPFPPHITNLSLVGLHCRVRQGSAHDTIDSDIVMSVMASKQEHRPVQRVARRVVSFEKGSLE